MSVDFVDGEASPGDQPLVGKTFVITGTLERFKREQLKEILEKMGALVTGSVSNKTDVLIVGANAGSKLDKAQSLGIETWDEEKTIGEIGL